VNVRADWRLNAGAAVPDGRREGGREGGLVTENACKALRKDCRDGGEEEEEDGRGREKAQRHGFKDRRWVQNGKGGMGKGVSSEHSPGHHPWSPPPRGAPLNIGVSVPCRDARMACLHLSVTFS